MAGRRPRALVVDSLLAVALALGTIVTLNASGDGPVAPFDWSVTRGPVDPRPGDVWNARIEVFGNDAPDGAVPLLAVLNLSTGEWTTTPARPTGKPGLYRARVVFRDAGQYTYNVLFGDELEKVPGRGAEPPPGPDAGDATRPLGLVLLALASTLPIALRRRWPAAVLAATLAAAIAAGLAYDNLLLAGPLVALYTVAAHVGRPRSLAAGAAAIALPVIVVANGSAGATVAVLLAVGAAWLLGDNLRTRRERAARLEAEHQANEQRTAAEEQARVARELHDIIGHSVSVMTIQAAAAGDAFDSRPAHVREALAAIEATGRETLSELRRLLAGFRADDDAVFAPAPGLDGLDALAERVRAAGLAVELSADRLPDALPPSVDLTAYRIVQEALTNTLKHARATRARVNMSRRDGVLEIEVVDDGQAGAANTEPGRGIIGMRERAELFGGRLSAGPGPDGGFAVRATIPVEEPS